MINSDLPFGGVGGSGYGRYHGKAGFEECCNKKSVLVKDALTMWPFNKVMPPYTSDKKQFITFLATKLDYTQS
jgi:aldehyde dehydrogenase (NAD+)